MLLLLAERLCNAGKYTMADMLASFLHGPGRQGGARDRGWAVLFIGLFYVFVMIVGIGSRALLGPNGESLAGDGGNLAAPYLAETLGGGSGSAGGDVFFAVISAVASPPSWRWWRGS